MSNTSCEKCVYALWFEDRSVGIWPYVEECNHIFGARVFDEDRAEDEDARCSFFVKKHELEYNKLRCSVCNSSKMNYGDFIYTDKSVYATCAECGNTVNVVVGNIPFC